MGYCHTDPGQATGSPAAWSAPPAPAPARPVVRSALAPASNLSHSSGTGHDRSADFGARLARDQGHTAGTAAAPEWTLPLNTLPGRLVALLEATEMGVTA